MMMAMITLLRSDGRDLRRSQVHSLAPGDTVVPLEAGLGTWSLTAVLPAAALFRIPETIPTLAAAALTIK